MASGAGTLLTIWQFGGHTTPVIWIVGAAAVGAATAGAAMLADDQGQAMGSPALQGPHSDDLQARERRRSLRATIENLLDAAIQLMASRPEHTGAIVYFPDAAGVLRPAFSHNKGAALSELPSFDKWQGCTGDSWGRDTQMVADLAAAGAEQLTLTWKLTPAQINATKSLKTVVSTPIRAPESPQRMIGVVSFDSTASVEESGLGTPQALAVARQIATAVAQIMELAAVDPAALV